jgi:hypothetical protein
MADKPQYPSSDWVEYNKKNPGLKARINAETMEQVKACVDGYPLDISKILRIALLEWLDRNRNWKASPYHEVVQYCESSKRRLKTLPNSLHQITGQSQTD